MIHIQTVELTSSQSSITFSSIPQNYDDLVLFINLRSDRVNTGDSCEIKPNNSLTSHIQLGDQFGTVVTGTTFAIAVPAANVTTNTYGNSKFYIYNYSSTTKPKPYSADGVMGNSGGSITNIVAGIYNDNSAVTSLVFESVNGTNFVSGSKASLYGITAGGDGTVSTA